MIVSLKVSDELYEAYGRKNEKNPRAAMTEALAKFVGEDSKARSITVAGEHLKTLQDLIGGPVDSAENLTKALKVALNVRLEDVEVKLTPS